MISEETINNEINKLLPAYREFLSNLVKINSSYGQEKEAQLIVKSRMEELGLNVQTVMSRQDQNSINLISIIHGDENEKYKSLILNAHCDVTPVDSIERWSRQPFSGEIRENILYGRGSYDDKAGIAIILLVVNVLKNLNVKLKGNLMIESVVEDETTGNGSKILVENGYTADGVIICDGTWPERIIYGHLGHVWIDVEITGEPVAACVESRGINPIYIGIEFIQKLRDAIEEFNKSEDPYEGIEKPFFVNIGSFHSGVYHGSVPADATLEIQIGFSDRYTPDEIIEKVGGLANSVSERITIRESLLKAKAYKTDKKNQLVAQLKTIIERNSRKEAQTVVVTGCCDMRHFPTKNICLYGPGGGKSPHGIDEYYFLDHMPMVARNILDFALAWCNERK
jgi:acetylornithine deacetylase